MSDVDEVKSVSAPLLMFAHKGNDWIRGSEQCVLDLLAGLDRTRYRLLVVANGRALLRESERLDVQAIRVAHWGGGLLLDAPYRHAMRGILRNQRPALIHANMAVTLPLVMPPSRELGIPVLSHLHAGYDTLGSRHQSLVREAEMIVGVAEHVVAPLREDESMRGRVRVIRNAVNVARLGSVLDGDIRGELALPSGAFVATSVGSLIARKCHDVTIRALGIARERGLDLHLLLCGDGDRERDLRGLANSLSLGEFVHFLGPRRDIGGILGASDVFVTSAGDEAMPLAVLEAQWVGVPVIASDVSAHRELLAERALAILTPLGNPESLARSIVALSHDPARRTTLGTASYQYARREYAMTRYIGEFEALYDEMLASAAR